MKIERATFRGAQFEEFTLPSVSIDRGILPPGFAGHRHQHDGYHILFVLDGVVEDHGLAAPERIDGAHVRESPPGDIHLLKTSQSARVILVTAHPDALGEVTPLISRRRLRADALSLRLVVQLDTELNADAPHVLAVEELAVRLVLGDHLGEPDAHAAWLNRLRERLHADFAGPVSLTEMCTDVGCTREHVIRSFRARYGCSMREYTMRLRVQYVCERLRQDTPLAKLALEAGFADQSHMTRIVTRVLGRPPGVVRRELRAN